MKHYYVVARDLWEKFPKDQFAHSHWIETDVPDRLLVVAEFPHEPACDFWESIHGVEPLPHLVFGHEPVRGQHIAQLTKIAAVIGDDTLTVAQKAGKIHPMFRPERV